MAKARRREARELLPRRAATGSPGPTTPIPKGWAADVALLTAEHRRLKDAVARLSPADLRRVPKGSRFTVAGLVRGAAAHDLYHAGQIQLLKRLETLGGPLAETKPQAR